MFVTGIEFGSYHKVTFISIEFTQSMLFVFSLTDSVCVCGSCVAVPLLVCLLLDVV